MSSHCFECFDGIPCNRENPVSRTIVPQLNAVHAFSDWGSVRLARSFVSAPHMHELAVSKFFASGFPLIEIFLREESRARSNEFIGRHYVRRAWSAFGRFD